jgi:hypothetical protein
MPTLMDLRNRFAKEDPVRGGAGSDESLIADVRGQLTPAQVVEWKLQRLLPEPSSLARSPTKGPPRAK